MNKQELKNIERDPTGKFVCYQNVVFKKDIDVSKQTLAKNDIIRKGTVGTIVDLLEDELGYVGAMVEIDNSSSGGDDFVVGVSLDQIEPISEEEYLKAKGLDKFVFLSTTPDDKIKTGDMFELESELKVNQNGKEVYIHKGTKVIVLSISKVKKKDETLVELYLGTNQKNIIIPFEKLKATKIRKL